MCLVFVPYLMFGGSVSTGFRLLWGFVSVGVRVLFRLGLYYCFFVLGPVIVSSLAGRLSWAGSGGFIVSPLEFVLLVSSFSLYT